MNGRIHIIGAGLAGLAAAVRLTGEGRAVSVYEAAGRAGGRCRSFVDKTFDRLIDNGNHLLFSGNTSAAAYLDEIGARDAFIDPGAATFPFVDIGTGQRWTIRMDDGPIPWWVFGKETRIPDTKLSDYLTGLKFPFANGASTVAGLVPTTGPLWERFWEPLTLAAINEAPDKAAAPLLWAVLKETFLKGGQACRPLVAKEGLGPSFIDPAVKYIEARGAELQFNVRVRSLAFDGARVSGLATADEVIEIGAEDQVVLAVSPAVAERLVPDLVAPAEGGVILNAHYLLDEPVEGPSLVAFINSQAHWAFVRENVVSLTISAAGALAGRGDDLLPELWRETQIGLGLGDRPYQAARLIKEKRATFDQSPEGVKRRAKPETRFPNLLLAGDWTDTGLPATMEGAIRSGHVAADLVRRRTA